MRFVFLCLAMVASLTACSVEPVDLETVQLEIEQELEDENWRAVRRLASKAVDSEGYGSLGTRTQASLLISLGAAEFETGRHVRARSTLSVALDQSAGSDTVRALFYLAKLDVLDEDWLGATARLNALSVWDADTYSQIPIDDMFLIANGLFGQEEWQELGRFYTDVVKHYVHADPEVLPDWLYYQAVDPLLYTGQPDLALKALDQVYLPEARLYLRTYGWFSELWSVDAFDAATDPVAGAEATLSRRQALLRYTQMKDFAYLEHVQDMVLLGRLDEAKRFARGARRDLLQQSALDYFDDNVYWLTTELAYLHYATGEIAEGEALFDELSPDDVAVLGLLDVRTTINHAAMDLARGRIDPTLAALRQLNRSMFKTESARLWGQSLAACAHHARGDTAEVEAALSTLEASWQDNAAAYQRALLCTERTEEAAQLLIERLSDDNHALEAMMNLQARPSIFESGPLSSIADLKRDFQRLAERPDVAAAIEGYGRVQSYDNIYVTYWGAL